MTRRTFLAGAAAAATLRAQPGARQFIMMGDSTARVPRRGVQKDHFQALGSVVQSVIPVPEFLLFLGDHFWGYTEDEADLRAQWREWFAAAAPFGDLPIHHLTGNHTCYDAMSARVFAETIRPRLPKGVEAAPDGLNFIWRDGDLLLVMANTVFNGENPEGRVDWRWVDGALTRHAGARLKLVAGHFPVFPVNAYTQPCWRIWAPDAAPLWQTLVKHRVAAYLCAHIIAFDVQVHDGVPQICSAGGGYPLFYPPQTEYFHFTQMAIDARGVSWQTVDERAAVRERGAWPLECPPVAEWPEQPPAAAEKPLTSPDVLLLHFEGEGAGAAVEDQTLLAGWTDSIAPETVWVGLRGAQLEVRLSPERGAPPLTWRGPAIGGKFGFDLALHPALGPGGVLYRASESAPWSSLTAAASPGFAPLAWPERWALGAGRAGYTRRGVKPETPERIEPFLGSGLRMRSRLIRYTHGGS